MHDENWKKPDSKGNKLHDSIYIYTTLFFQAKNRQTENGEWLAKGREQSQELPTKGMGDFRALIEFLYFSVYVNLPKNAAKITHMLVS